MRTSKQNAARREQYRTNRLLRVKQSAYAKDYYFKNKAHLLHRTQIRILENTKIIKKAKDVVCQDCGQSFPFYVMDFDHRPGEVKLANVSQMLSATRRRLLLEIAKCDVVCSNCHRERTHGTRPGS